MKKLLIFLKRFVIRAALVLTGLALIVASLATGYEFIGFFNHTAYRFVAIFLLLILLSNLLAKIARSYIEV